MLPVTSPIRTVLTKTSIRESGSVRPAELACGVARIDGLLERQRRRVLALDEWTTSDVEAAPAGHDENTAVARSGQGEAVSGTRPARGYAAECPMEVATKLSVLSFERRRCRNEAGDDDERHSQEPPRDQVWDLLGEDVRIGGAIPPEDYEDHADGEERE